MFFKFPFLVGGLESFAVKKKGASGIFIFMKNICE